MTENEKLRALLAKAREIARSVRNAGSLPYAQWSRDQHEADSIIQRIDAALAEPVEGCARCETLRELADTAAAEQGLAQRRMMEAQRERDEARAGVEQMNLEAADVRRLARSMAEDAFRKRDAAQERAEERNDEANRLQRYLNMAAKERDEARAEVERLREAINAWAKTSEWNYRRGAEAMREAAAVRIDAEGINGCTGPFFGNIIRTLPVPEYKP